MTNGFKRRAGGDLRQRRGRRRRRHKERRRCEYGNRDQSKAAPGPGMLGQPPEAGRGGEWTLC